MIFLKIRLHFLYLMAIFTRPTLAGIAYNILISGGLSLLLITSLLFLTFITALLWTTGIILWASRRCLHNSVQPQVTVIVAARNEEKYIQDCLNALIDQNYPPNCYSICLVDDHSTDRTLQIASEIARRNSGRLQIMSAPDCPPGFGPKKNALQHAINQSATDLLLFTDADCRVPPSWISSMVRQFDEYTGAVAGTVLPQKRPGLFATLHWFDRLLVNYTSASAIGWGSPASVNGGSLSYRRTSYNQAGGMKHLEIASGDDDLTVQAIARCGWRVHFNSEPGSVVEDLRVLDGRQYSHATIRHQSTARFYPLRWRLAFLLTIALGALFILFMGLALFSKTALVYLATAFLLRILIDGIGIYVFAKKLCIRIPLVGFIGSEVCLPFYLLARPLLTLVPEFSWRNRTHRI